MRLLARRGVARSAIIFALLLVPAALASQNPQPPQIKVSTRLVEFGVIARNNDGPVEDMTKDDFVVLDRGKPQKISVFTVESVKSPATIQQLAKMLPPNTFSDLPQYGAGRPRSVTIVLLDNLNTLYGSAPGAAVSPERTPSRWREHAARAGGRPKHEPDWKPDHSAGAGELRWTYPIIEWDTTRQVGWIHD
jgi:hypothetical protein